MAAVFRREASRQLAEAAAYYRQQAGAATGDGFVDAVTEALALLERAPQLGSLSPFKLRAAFHVRTWPLQRFPSPWSTALWLAA